MYRISNLYKKGIQHWNRNKLEDAKHYFDSILKDISLMDEYEKTKIAEFYIYIKSYKEASLVLEDMVKKYENITFSITN